MKAGWGKEAVEQGGEATGKEGSAMERGRKGCCPR